MPNIPEIAGLESNAAKKFADSFPIPLNKMIEQNNTTGAVMAAIKEQKM